MVGLMSDLDEGFLLKRHQSYHESQHVLNSDYDLLAGGIRPEHQEVCGYDEVYIEALGDQCSGTTC